MVPEWARRPRRRCPERAPPPNRKALGVDVAAGFCVLQREAAGGRTEQTPFEASSPREFSSGTCTSRWCSFPCSRQPRSPYPSGEVYFADLKGILLKEAFCFCRPLNADVFLLATRFVRSRLLKTTHTRAQTSNTFPAILQNFSSICARLFGSLSAAYSGRIVRGRIALHVLRKLLVCIGSCPNAQEPMHRSLLTSLLSFLRGCLPDLSPFSTARGVFVNTG